MSRETRTAIGTASSITSMSAAPCTDAMPHTPQSRTIRGSIGKKQIPCRASPSSSDGSARPMPEQSIFTMMPKPWNGMARHWMRRENTPMRTSSASSSVKSSRMGRAKIPTTSATAEMPATHAIMENRNDSRTRSNRFAPHEKPATG